MGDQKKSREVTGQEERAEGKTRGMGKKHGKGRNLTDLTGRRFGRLVAQYPTARRDRKGSVYWHCTCDCGKEAEVTENGLVHGNNRSCGCLKRENQKRVVDQLHMVDGTCLEWLEKRKSRSDNTSGFRGIYCLKNGRYRVGIGFKRERYYLGTYDTMEDAVKVRLEAEKKIHGEFVRQYRKWKERADGDAEWGKAHPLTFRVQKGAGGSYRVVTELEEETDKTAP
ncbi:MAG TPA: hypothetical protein H9763_11245 [Candidatus Eisenbergiella merdigallinarum]|uniref:AP2 domain-containing protein n=1 Tax=Candidatus Eisenbergiella merdigallinarum TaxID=2838552 RepID=A0A9D2MS66_9FIRM|nr:hypothetical protein [Candidatus Eisenbergiella merdigallinarum]